MKPKTDRSPGSVVREIKRRTRRKFNPEEKIRIILEGLKGEYSISGICRREGIAPSLYYKWSKAFLQAGKRGLKGDTLREANSDEVSGLRQENEQLKQSEKMQIIRLVDESSVSVRQTFFELNINRSTFYKWYHRYQEGGFDALADRYRLGKSSVWFGS
jgi:transposase